MIQNEFCPTKQTLSDVEQGLNLLGLQPETINRILIYYDQYKKMSAAFLAHKFLFNASMANKIMKVIQGVEKSDPAYLQA